MACYDSCVHAQEHLHSLPALREADETLWALTSAHILRAMMTSTHVASCPPFLLNAFDWGGIIETLLEVVAASKEQAFGLSVQIVKHLLWLTYASPRNLEFTAEHWRDEVSTSCCCYMLQYRHFAVLVHYHQAV